MFNYTQGDPLWEERTRNILNATTAAFFTDSVMYERACEPVDTCQVDQRGFKGYTARWMASSTQMAPFTYDLVIPLLRASAEAAAETCTGGDDGLACGQKWVTRKWEGEKDVGLQMAALEVIQSNLITRVDPPVTDEHGGTSKGNPGGGSPPPEPKPSSLTMSITTKDRAGAGVLTGVVALIVIGSTVWLVWD